MKNICFEPRFGDPPVEVSASHRTYCAVCGANRCTRPAPFEPVGLNSTARSVASNVGSWLNTSRERPTTSTVLTRVRLMNVSIVTGDPKSNSIHVPSFGSVENGVPAPFPDVANSAALVSKTLSATYCGLNGSADAVMVGFGNWPAETQPPNRPTTAAATTPQALQCLHELQFLT